ncbi:hypothetical protein SLS55_002645 [Diplodia seriata]|uniref:Bzip transcription factor n=1 Tax=Diplodia seriata TaxID=420778 RepID=A0ABR3CVS8_9PEZI
MDTAAQSPPVAAPNAPNAASTPQPAAKRRRTSGQPSSRGVANLTPEQLARKRQNDREAQRAIRERTKQQIERLNGRIRELESQQPYHELQMALRAKEAVQAENDDIRRRLSSVMSLIQPILGTHGLNGTPSSPTSQSANGRNWGAAFPGVPPTSHVRAWHPQQPPYDQPRSNIHPDLEFGQNSDERLGVNFLLDNRAKLNNGLPHGGPEGMQSSGLDFNGRPMEAWNTLPRSLDATCPLDSLLLDFLAERHAQAAEGAPLKGLVGPAYPDFSYLLNPDKNDQSHPLSKVFTDILRTFPDISGLPERVAVLPRLRDRIIADQPQQAFDNFFIPYTTSLSLNWPHNPRDCLLPASSVAAAGSINTTPGGIPIDPATEASPAPTAVPPPASSITSEGSPKPADGDAISGGDSNSSANSNSDGNGNAADGNGDDDEDQWVINPAFEAHLRNIDNWSLGPEFRAAFPELAAYVKILEQ